MKSKPLFKFKSWRIIFYIAGWIFGALSPIFWLYQYGFYLAFNNGDKFFTDAFHRRVFYWGVLWVILCVLVFVTFEVFMKIKILIAIGIILFLGVGIGISAFEVTSMFLGYDSGISFN